MGGMRTEMCRKVFSDAWGKGEVNEQQECYRDYITLAIHLDFTCI